MFFFFVFFTRKSVHFFQGSYQSSHIIYVSVSVISKWLPLCVKGFEASGYRFIQWIQYPRSTDTNKKKDKCPRKVCSVPWPSVLLKVTYFQFVLQTRWHQGTVSGWSDCGLWWSFFCHPQAVPPPEPLQLQPDLHPPRLYGAHNASQRWRCKNQFLLILESPNKPIWFDIISESQTHACRLICIRIHRKYYD